MSQASGIARLRSRDRSMILKDNDFARTGETPTLRILVADDNTLIRTALRGLLRNLGHSVAMVSNGRQAVEMALGTDFDLVFLDMQMPEMGGMEAARLLRHSGRDGHGPRIVGISGGGQDARSCEASGMEEILPKPVLLADLIRIITRPAKDR
jgi:CheY-like chemotaxis protein